MKTNQCDRERIVRFFQSATLDEDIELTLHLERCESCRRYFDSQAAQPELWLEAGQLLQPTDFDWPKAGQIDTAQATKGRLETPSIRAVLDSLVPSEDPKHLGRLGTYEVSGVVGAGGMGVVLKAFDRSLDRVVAIKVLAPHLGNSSAARKRFSREAKAAAAVLHPNVIPIYGVSSDATFPYLVMAYVRGGSLQTRLEREGPLSPTEVLRIGAQVAAGLAAAHGQGLIHRDIKPENILLEEGVERVTLTDFGLARAVDDTSVTLEGSIAGTPQFMSPEQARGESVDQKSDLFSLGSVLYNLCTGRPPFRADSSYGVMRKISDEKPTPIPELNPEIPAWLIFLIEKLMAKKKSQRFSSAAEVQEVLEACLSHTQQPALVPLPVELAKKKHLIPQQRGIGSRSSIFWGLSMLALCSVLCVFWLPQNVTPQQQTTPTSDAAGASSEVLGKGYVRQGDFIYFEDQRIDRAGKEDIDQFAKFTGLDLKLASNVDAASFKALSEEYTKDRNQVYYKWISPGRFWVVELPQADVSSFEVLGFNLAKDREKVWWYGKPLPEIDPATVRVVNDGFVWKDANHVWYQLEQIPNADAASFRHLGQAFYRDRERVYWSSKNLDDADPDTFRTFGDDLPYGADRTHVWKAAQQLRGLDGASFEAVHQSIYKDKNGVYANGYPIEKADPKTFRKVADLDQHQSALFADGNNFYVHVPYRGETYKVTVLNDSLRVKRQLWAPGTPKHRTRSVGPVAIASAELAAGGWRNQKVMIDQATEANQMTVDQEAHVLNLYTSQFTKAWEILATDPPVQVVDNPKPGEGLTADAVASSSGWRTDVIAFNRLLGELAEAGKLPDASTLAKRVSIVPGNADVDSEVIPVTDGAGGFIDLNPAEDTIQFRVNQALKDQRVEWEFVLSRDAAASASGVTNIVPVLANNGLVPFLGSLFIHSPPGDGVAVDFKAGDRVKLVGTIGDSSGGKGLASAMAPVGPVAVYHLQSSPHTIFWIGLKEVTLTGSGRERTPSIQEPARGVSAFVRALLKASLEYDEAALQEMYASEVRLLPGNRLFHFGLELPGKLSASGVLVKREDILPALKEQASRDPIPRSMVGGLASLFRIEQVSAPVGELIAEPNLSNDSVFGRLQFTLEKNDILIKVSVPNAFRYLQLRKSGESWIVVAEY
ncbi:MAG: protein kinase domain-containing protein [Aureliella sp.]